VTEEICVVVLAAGQGTRLRPLTEHVPKALCPVGNVPLLDGALGRLARLGFAGPAAVAVNAWHNADQIVRHVGRRAHLSVETGPAPYGSAGGLAALRGWIRGRHVLVGNADAYLTGGDIAPLLDGWDGDTVRILGVPAGDRRPEFGDRRFAGFSLVPGKLVAALADEPADLVRAVWRPAEARSMLRVVTFAGTYLDSGTHADYLAANLLAARSAPDRALVDPDAVVTGTVTDAVVGRDCRVYGRIERAVVWPGGIVAPDEHLADAIRYDRDRTVRVGS